LQNSVWRQKNKWRSKNKHHKLHRLPGPSVVFKISKTFQETQKKYESNEQLKRRLSEFLLFKKNTPTAQFGAKDKPLTNAGHFNGMMHAGLTFDLSIFYTIEGSNPKTIKLYGIYSHDEAGTGTPPNIKRQQSLSSRFKQQVFEKEK
jgi:mRNA-degrading endonuclease YafQ of YafQ-DinJ toxin-antitoxin module